MDLTKRTGDVAPEYRPLYTYLENRFADTVVLTFGQIEDLIGFKLPDLASQDEHWWANSVPHTTPPGHAQSWIVARRLAHPNLRARIVGFERLP